MTQRIRKMAFWTLALICSLLLVACSRPEQGKEPQTPFSSVRVSEEEEEKGKAPSPVKMFQIEGKVYKETGLRSSSPRCGTPDGEFSEWIEEGKRPEKDGQVNFKGAKHYQAGFALHRLDAQMDDGFYIFMEEGNELKEMPEDVAWVKGKVLEVGDPLRIAITEVPQEFSWIFFQGFAEEEDISRLKPVDIPLKDFDPSKYPPPGKENGEKERDPGKEAPKETGPIDFSSEALKGKTLQIWFDGKVEELRPESSVPARMETVYQIRLVP